MRITALTPRPTTADVKARCEAKEIGLWSAQAELNEEWLQSNIKKLKGELEYAAQSGVSVDELAKAMLNMLTVFLTAMDES